MEQPDNQSKAEKHGLLRSGCGPRVQRLMYCLYRACIGVARVGPGASSVTARSVGFKYAQCLASCLS